MILEIKFLWQQQVIKVQEVMFMVDYDTENFHNNPTVAIKNLKSWTGQLSFTSLVNPLLNTNSLQNVHLFFFSLMFVLRICYISIGYSLKVSNKFVRQLFTELYYLWFTVIACWFYFELHLTFNRLDLIHVFLIFTYKIYKNHVLCVSTSGDYVNMI